MEYEKPATGISLNKSFYKAKVFNVDCDCSYDSHSVKMWIEVNSDKTISDIEVSFYVTTYTPSFWQNLPAKIKAIFDILVKGVSKQEHHLILSKQTAYNFAETIKETIKDLERK